MAVGIVKIDVASAVQVVDLAASCPIETSIEVDGSAVYARESIIEFRVADEEGALKGPASCGLGKIEREPIAPTNANEVTRVSFHFQS
jgi:hypothetical protein